VFVLTAVAWIRVALIRAVLTGHAGALQSRAKFAPIRRSSPGHPVQLGVTPSAPRRATSRGKGRSPGGRSNSPSIVGQVRPGSQPGRSNRDGPFVLAPANNAAGACLAGLLGQIPANTSCSASTRLHPLLPAGSEKRTNFSGAAACCWLSGGQNLVRVRVAQQRAGQTNSDSAPIPAAGHCQCLLLLLLLALRFQQVSLPERQRQGPAPAVSQPWVPRR